MLTFDTSNFKNKIHNLSWNKKVSRKPYQTRLVDSLKNQVSFSATISSLFFMAFKIWPTFSVNDK